MGVSGELIAEESTEEHGSAAGGPEGPPSPPLRAPVLSMIMYRGSPAPAFVIIYIYICIPDITALESLAPTAYQNTLLVQMWLLLF